MDRESDDYDGEGGKHDVNNTKSHCSVGSKVI